MPLPYEYPYINITCKVILCVKIYFSDYLIYNENQTVKEFTGEFIEKTSISIFNKNLNKRGKNISFSNFVEENCVFYVSKYI